MSVIIPHHELADFARLPEACRTQVRTRLRVVKRILTLTRGIQAAIDANAPTLGWSPKTLRKYCDLYRHTRDWRVLVDRSRFPDADDTGSIPAAVIDLWKTLCERNQRKCKPAYRELIRIWRSETRNGSQPSTLNSQPSVAAIEWPERDPLTGVPRGCTYRNLMRHKPTKYELTLGRIGRSAASAMLPKVLRTRIGLLPGQYYILDDQDYDVQVAFVGVNRKMTRPSGFNALDFASACEVLQGYKPTVLNSDGTKQKLRQVDFEWFVVNLLTTIGYREEEGTIIVGEHGTAKAGDDFIDRVTLATGGRVTFDASGIHGEQVAGLFRGQPRGNPRYKASRESWFNLLRNEMAALPGPTGMNRAHAPEETYGMDIYVRSLLDAIADRPDLAEKLALPVLRWPDFLRLTSLIVQRINDRTEHELEGWGDHLADEWRLAIDQAWTPATSYLALPAPQRQLADAIIAQTPGLWRTRKLSPSEVWRAALNSQPSTLNPSSPLTRVSGAMIPVLLGPQGGRLVTVTPDHHIVIQDTEIEPDPMWFDAALTSSSPVSGLRSPLSPVILPQGEKVLAYINPFDPGAIQVCDPEGRFLGTAPRVQRHSPLEVDNLRARYGAVKRIETQLLTPVAQRGAASTRARIAMHQDNTRALSEASPSQISDPQISDPSSTRRDALASAAARARELMQDPQTL